MDKTIILASAGSGKTTYLVKQIPKEKRTLILTYTDNNIQNLQENIISEFGYFPKNIRLQTYFTFLYSFCIQPFLMDEYNLKGLIFKQNPILKARGNKRYLTNNKSLYYNRAAKFIEEKGLNNDVNRRLEKYFQYLFIDEIQDFAGQDFNLLEKISNSNINILFVGDFYQHTYDTSRDGNVKYNIHNNYYSYKVLFKKLGFFVDEKTLIKSYRCCPKICEYISNNLKINIESRNEKNNEIKYINNRQEIDKIIQNKEIIKLFFREHYKYKCRSRNWGDCKGENKYNDVCVILNKTTMAYYNKNELHKLKPTTLNKLYVAISRAHGNVYFISECDIGKYKKQKSQ